MLVAAQMVLKKIVARPASFVPHSAPPRLHPSQHATLCLLFALLGIGPVHAGLQIAPVTLEGQTSPSVTAELDDGFVVTATSRREGTAHLHTQRVGSSGTVEPARPVARGTDWFVNWADFPSLAIAANGDWVTFVLRKSDPVKPYAYDIWVLRSQNRGASWSEPSKLNDDATTTEHGFVSLVASGADAGDDAITAVWLDGRQNAQGAPSHDEGHGAAITTLRSATLTRDRISASVELDDLTCDCCTTDAVRTAAGPVVVYRDRTSAQIRDIGYVLGKQQAWSKPAIVAADNWLMPGCPVNGPALTPLGDDLLASWPTMREGEMVLRAARFDGSAWHPLPDIDQGSELAGRVDLAPWTQGRALVSWLGAEADASVLYLGVVDAKGALIERHAITTLPRGRSTGMPRLASAGAHALLVWTESADTGPRIAGVLIKETADE